MTKVRKPAVKKPAAGGGRAAEERFDAIVTALDSPAVERGKRTSLNVHGKVFAWMLRGELVLKLPAARAEALVDSGAGRYLVMGRRQMKEWIVVALDRRDAAALAREALAAVSATSASR